MIKKAIAAAFVSAGLLGTFATAASAAPPAAACHGLHTAHSHVPEHAAQAHRSIPHCPVHNS